MGLFGLDMLLNYDDRKVERFEKGTLIVDTCAVSDSAQPYETGIKHSSYNEGKWIIVQLYDSVNEAKKGHKQWVKRMTSKSLPKELKDVSSASITEFVDAVKGQKWREYKKTSKKGKK